MVVGEGGLGGEWLVGRLEEGGGKGVEGRDGGWSG